jgi:hypothetical protein
MQILTIWCHLGRGPPEEEPGEEAQPRYTFEQPHLSREPIEHVVNYGPRPPRYYLCDKVAISMAAWSEHDLYMGPPEEVQRLLFRVVHRDD